MPTGEGGGEGDGGGEGAAAAVSPSMCSRITQVRICSTTGLVLCARVPCVVRVCSCAGVQLCGCAVVRVCGCAVVQLCSCAGGRAVQQARAAVEHTVYGLRFTVYGFTFMVYVQREVAMPMAARWQLRAQTETCLRYASQ
jgi:hypothetical protein